MSRGIEESLVARAAEFLSTSISRRQALNKFFRIATGAVFMAVLGKTSAYAAACPNSCGQCFPPRGVFCQGCPNSYPGGCPQGYTVCTTGQGIGCVYNTGYWTDTCSNGGTVRCWDCKSATGTTCGCCSAAALPPPPPPPPPPRCDDKAGITATATWLIGRDGVATPAAEQLQFALRRYEARPENHIYLDEWAVLSATDDRPALKLASTGGFAARVGASPSPSRRGRGRDEHIHERTFEGPGRDGGTVLVVEAADHGHDETHMHPATLVPFQVRLPVRLLKGLQFWFRAEFDAGQDVDRLTLLDMPSLAPLGELDAALRRYLRLNQPEGGNHRVVVFGAGTIDGDGRLDVNNGLVLVPKCCCGAYHCV